MIKSGSAALVLLAMLTSGCGGGGGGGSPTYSLGGTVAGLGSGRQLLVLSGAGTQVTISSNGNFRFPDHLPQGAKYGLVIQQQPLSQTCLVANGSDSVGIKADVSNITVVCADNPALLGGQVSGLPAGASVTIASSSVSSVTVSANGTYNLPVRPAPGNNYSVSVITQPMGATCVVGNASGTAGSVAVTNIDVSCSRASLTVGGDLSGLALGQQVQLKLTGSGVPSSLLSLGLNGTFSFSSPITYGGDYVVTVEAQPTGQTCSLGNAVGQGIMNPVSQLRVSCTGNRHSLGGSATGLASMPGGQPLVLRNGGDSVSIASNGPFRFPALLADAASYSVTVASQPTGQTCSLTNDSGTAVTAPVSTVVAQCLSFVWRSRLIAGSGVAGHLDDVAGAARFSSPSAVVVGPRGDLLVADFSSSRVRMVTMPLGAVSTLAGSSVPGLVNSVSPLSASFRAPAGLAVDAAGNVFVADSGNHVIRRIAAGTGEVTTWAGSGAAGYANGLGGVAQFNNPRGMAIDAAGHLLVADTGNHVVRRIAPDGTVSLAAGTPGQRGRVDGAAAAATFNGPSGLAISAAGAIYVADTQNHLIRVVTPAGVVATVAGSGQSGSQDGTGAFAAFSLPLSVALDGQSALVVVDGGNHAIRHVQLQGTSGTVLTIAGAGRSGYREGVGAAISFDQPTGLAVDAAGNLLITEGSGHRLRSLYRSPN